MKDFKKVSPKIKGKKLDNIYKDKNLFFSKNNKFPICLENRKKQKVNVLNKKLSHQVLTKTNENNKMTTRKLLEDKIKRKKTVSAKKLINKKNKSNTVIKKKIIPKKKIINKISYSKNKINQKYTISINMKNFKKKKKVKKTNRNLIKKVKEINDKVEYLIKDINKQTNEQKKNIKKKPKIIKENKRKIINNDFNKLKKEQFLKWNSILDKLQLIENKDLDKSIKLKLEKIKNNTKNNIEELKGLNSMDNSFSLNNNKRIDIMNKEKWVEIDKSKISPSLQSLSIKDIYDIDIKHDFEDNNIINDKQIIDKDNIWKENFLNEENKGIEKETNFIDLNFDEKKFGNKNNLMNSFSIDFISNFIFEEILEELMSNKLFIKLFLPSNYLKGIKTNSNKIKEYLNLIKIQLNLDILNVKNQLNKPLGPNKNERLKYFHIENEESELEKINYEPIINIDIYFKLENQIYINKKFDNNQIDLSHIHNKMIFDVFNEALDSFRIWNMKGEPIGENYKLKEVKDKDIDNIIDKSINMVLDWSSILGGFMPFKDDSEMNLPILFEEDTLNLIKEEKLYKIVFEDENEEYYNWFDISDELLEIKIEIADDLFNNLLIDLCSNFLDIN